MELGHQLHFFTVSFLVCCLQSFFTADLLPGPGPSLRQVPGNLRIYLINIGKHDDYQAHCKQGKGSCRKQDFDG